MGDVIRKETATVMYKSQNDRTPEYLSKRLVKNSTRNIRQPRNTETDLLVPLRKQAMCKEVYLFVDLNYGISSSMT